MHKRLFLLVVFVLGTLASCRTDAILRSKAQERSFERHYIGKPFYTAMVLRPYRSAEGYLIDLTGETAQADTAVRAAITIPLGTPLMLTAIHRNTILARIEGYQEVFRIRVHTEMGTMKELAKELQLLLAPDPPLMQVRPAMRPLVARQQIARGMSRREVYMSWGLPDKITTASGSSGMLEEWIYYDRGMHLFLHNGFVTNWQQY